MSLPCIGLSDIRRAGVRLQHGKPVRAADSARAQESPSVIPKDHLWRSMRCGIFTPVEAVRRSTVYGWTAIADMHADFADDYERKAESHDLTDGQRTCSRLTAAISTRPRSDSVDDEKQCLVVWHRTTTICSRGPATGTRKAMEPLPVPYSYDRQVGRGGAPHVGRGQR